MMKKKRIAEKIFALLIFVTGLAGLLMQCGVFEQAENRVSGQMTLFLPIATVFLILYYLGQFFFLRVHERGIFPALWKYISFIGFTFSVLIGWLYLRPFYAKDPEYMKTAYLLLHVLLPLEVVTEWLISEKGHFRKKYIPFAMGPIILYGMIAVIAGSLGHGFGSNGADFPYAFMNTKQLGYEIAGGNCFIILLMLWMYCHIICALDRWMKKRRRR